MSAVLRRWTVASLLLLAGLSAAQADRRVALVIGNGAYQSADRLANPRLDAQAVRATLAGLGFEVIYGEDLDKKAMERVIGRFAAASREADVALAYYAGHGATFGDTPYLVPIDAEFTTLAAMPYELVPLESLLGELRQAKGVRIAIFDVCRDNARERELKRVATRGGEPTRGFARPRNPEGLIVAYATQYGMTAADGPAGTNSPFTAALVKLLPTPGQDVKSLFLDIGGEVVRATKGGQRPAIEISLYESYALVDGKGGPALPPVAVAPPAIVPPAAAPAGPDGAFLAFIAGLTDRAMLAQLGRHDDPAVRAAAERRLAMLPAVPAPPRPGPAAEPPATLAGAWTVRWENNTTNRLTIDQDASGALKGSYVDDAGRSCPVRGTSGAPARDATLTIRCRTFAAKLVGRSSADGAFAGTYHMERGGDGAFRMAR